MHELHQFMNRLASELAAEYQRIHARAAEDPGTAGDQGEENWATILREWLPREFVVVTKGRILGASGEASGQVDVLILSPAYPPYLVDKKLFLASAVLAAFECKVTLRAKDLEKAVRRGIEIKRLTPRRHGTPYKETTSTLIYGILAHTSEWKDKGRLSKFLDRAHADLFTHADEITDIVCVSDCGTWAASKRICAIAHTPDGVVEYVLSDGQNPFKYAQQVGVSVGLREYTPYVSSSMGPFLFTLYQRLAWEFSYLRPIASYFRLVGLGGIGVAVLRHIDKQTFSSAVSEGAEGGKVVHLVPGEWSEWANQFYDF